MVLLIWRIIFMNTAYVYLQLYKLFDDCTPIKADCGQLCNKACCKGSGGMYLFPGEKKVYELLNPSWINISESDFFYTKNRKQVNVPFASCNGHCDRFQRPLACRIFPLTPILDENGNISIITDPRAKSICPLSKGLYIEDYDSRFIRNIRRAFNLLMKNGDFAEYMKAYTDYINEFRRFYK